jgi:hypothetical protein
MNAVLALTHGGFLLPLMPPLLLPTPAVCVSSFVDDLLFGIITSSSSCCSNRLLLLLLPASAILFYAALSVRCSSVGVALESALLWALSTQ